MLLMLLIGSPRDTSTRNTILPGLFPELFPGGLFPLLKTVVGIAVIKLSAVAAAMMPDKMEWLNFFCTRIPLDMFNKLIS